MHVMIHTISTWPRRTQGTAGCGRPTRRVALVIDETTAAQGSTLIGSFTAKLLLLAPLRVCRGILGLRIDHGSTEHSINSHCLPGARNTVALPASHFTVTRDAAMDS